MITVEGKVVFTTLDELVDPTHTAVVVVDMQRDFCLPGGAFDRLGIDLSMYPPMIPRLAHFLDEARAAHVSIIYIQMTSYRDRTMDSPAQIRFNLRLHDPFHGEDTPLLYCVEGTAGQEIIPAVRPQSGDFIVKKYRSSAFWGTNLDMLLRSNGIKTVIMTGVTTEGCVESTARDALFSDYYVVLPEDCVASDDPRQHEASLFLMRHRFDVVTSDEIQACWRAPQERDELDSHSVEARSEENTHAHVAPAHRK